MNDQNISIQLYADKYGEGTFIEGNIVNSILRKKFGFELSIDSETERTRRILTLDQTKKLQLEIDKSLKAHDEMLNRAVL